MYARKWLKEFKRIPDEYKDDLTAVLIALAGNASDENDKRESAQIIVELGEQLNQEVLKKYSQELSLEDKIESMNEVEAEVNE
jgi:hypothetical protein